MRHIVIIDTCIFLNVLNIPGFNQENIIIMSELAALIEQTSVNLLLPFAAMLETGNHIAHISDGGLRRKYGIIFIDQVAAALSGNAPWTPTQTVDLAIWAEWLPEYPDRAMSGMGLGDLSIIKEWEAACARHPSHRVRIWSIDGHLLGFDRPAGTIGGSK